MKPQATRIGVDLGGTKIEIAVLGSSGEIILRERRPTPRGDYSATVNAIAELVEAAEEKLGVSGLSVGVGIPGVISRRTGVVKNSNSLWLIGHAFDADVSARLGRKARFENDANCFTLSEATDGAAQGAEVAFGVILGTGVGGGIAVGGKILRGTNEICGEWGHNPLPWMTPEEFPGRECYCGRTGCIETFLSGPGLAYEHRKKFGQDLVGEEIIKLALRGDAQALQSLALYQERLARALASVINLLDPDVIVLGGGLSNIRSLYSEVPRLWKKFCFTPVSGACEPIATKLVQAKFGDSSGVRGAAWLWK